MSIGARGEMCAVALYTALLDGRIKSVFLESPPATQDAASDKTGRGPAIEMLNGLRYIDLPHIAGLLHPTAIVVAGEFPSTCAWAEDFHRRLGAPGGFRRVKEMKEWTLSL